MRNTSCCWEAANFTVGFCAVFSVGRGPQDCVKGGQVTLSMFQTGLVTVGIVQVRAPLPICTKAPDSLL